MELTMAYLLESQIEGCPFQVAEFHKRMKCQMPCRGQSLMLVATWSGMALCRALGRFRSLLLCLDNLAPSQHSRPNWLRGELAEALRQPCSTDFSFFLSFSILLLVLLYAFVIFHSLFAFFASRWAFLTPASLPCSFPFLPWTTRTLGASLHVLFAMQLQCQIAAHQDDFLGVKESCLEEMTLVKFERIKKWNKNCELLAHSPHSVSMLHAVRT